MAEFHQNCAALFFLHYFCRNGYKFYLECSRQYTNFIGWDYVILLIFVVFFVSKNMRGSFWLHSMRNNVLFVSCTARVFSWHFVNTEKSTNCLITLVLIVSGTGSLLDFCHSEANGLIKYGQWKLRCMLQSKLSREEQTRYSAHRTRPCAQGDSPCQAPTLLSRDCGYIG